MAGLTRSPLSYVPRGGPIQSASPGAVSLYLGGFLLAGLFAPDPFVALAAACGAALAGIGAGAGRAVLFSLRIGLLLAVLLTAINALVADRGATVLARLGEWPLLGPVQVTAEAVASGAMTGLRALSVMVVAGVWSACVDPDRVLASSHRFAGRSALTATLVSRFIPLAAEDRSRLSEAAKLRGPAASPVTTAAMARRLLEGSLDRSVDVAATLELRGFSRPGPAAAPLPPPSRHQRRFLIGGSASLAVAVALLVIGQGGFTAYPEVSFETGPAGWGLSACLAALGFLTWPGRGKKR